MDIVERIFGNKINQAVNAGIKDMVAKGTLWNNVGGQVTHQSGKYQNANGNAGEYTEAYKEELYIYGCVYLISNEIAKLPLLVYDSPKKEKIITEHPIYTLFKKPNFKDSMNDVKESISANLELTGNTFMLVDRNGNNIATGTPTAIYPLISSKVKIVKHDKIEAIKTIKDIIKGYEYGKLVGDKAYKVDEIIHEKKFNPNDEILGMSPIQAAAITLDTTTEAKLQNYQIFKNGLSADAVFETEQNYSEQTHKRLKQDYKEKHTGTHNSHTPMFLWNGLKHKGIGIHPKDLEYISGLKLNREDLCGFLYQVPLILLGVLENASYSNITEAKKILYEFSIIPRLTKNREVYQKLLDMFGNEKGYWIDFDLSNVAALKESRNDRVTRGKELFALGVPMKEINDVEQLGLKKFPGWETGYLPFNLVPAGAVGETEPEKSPAEGEEGKSKHIIKNKKFTPEMKEAKWKKFASETERIENKYTKDLVPYFIAQEKEVLSNLNKFKSITYEKVQENTFMFVGEDTQGKKAINIESVLFDKGKERKKLQKINFPIHEESVKTSGQAEFDLLGIDASFDVQNPRVQTWLKAKSLKSATLVTDTVRDKVKKALVTGVNEGESIPDISKRIKNAYSGYTTPKGFEVTRIARTEVIGASNHGALEAYEQAGVAKKAWLSTRSGDARDWHIATEDKYQDGIKVTKDFIIAETGTHTESPGNSGVAEEDINCRCTVFPVIEE